LGLTLVQKVAQLLGMVPPVYQDVLELRARLPHEQLISLDLLGVIFFEVTNLCVQEHPSLRFLALCHVSRSEELRVVPRQVVQLGLAAASELPESSQ